MTAHIEHILDAVDLLLERCRDRTRDCFRRGAGIGRRDLHRRRDHLRILRDRQNGERTESQQRHERAEHGREAGTVDKEMCQAHFEGSVLILAGGRVPDRAVLRLDLGSRRRIGELIDDDPVVWSEAGPDDP